MKGMRKEYFKNLRSGIEYEPKTAFENNYYYGYKWKRYLKDKTIEDKIEGLIYLSKINIGRNRKPYEERRAKTHGILKSCFVCGRKAFYQHHLIQLKNGGFDNGINRVPICPNCHEKVHPHLFSRKYNELNEELNKEFSSAVA